MTAGNVFACFNPSQTLWQLGHLHCVTNTFILGWNVQNSDEDGGVPRSIAEVIAHSLTDNYRVTFPCTSVDRAAVEGDCIPNSADWARRLDAVSISRSGRKCPDSAVLLSTRNWETLIRAFDDGGFPWWLQGQILMLTDQDNGDQLGISNSDIALLSCDDWCRKAQSVRSLSGVVRPGVDGSLAGIWTSDEIGQKRLLRSLEVVCRHEGLGWDILDEGAFEKRL
ncbi:MAG: hypothetical protein ABJZ55_15245 [Fuerstiella sp.]